jgi:AcrR family transcriptional regulator
VADTVIAARAEAPRTEAPRTEAPRTDPIAQIRNEPVQARSTARLAALLDAAAHVVDEIGYERLTTAMVAERAGASIGTVYRYFPDRIAVLQSLAARNAERASAGVLPELEDRRHADWVSAFSASYDVYISFFRNEPGFASLRYGDVLDLRPFVGIPTMRSMSARAVDVLVSRFGMQDTPASRAAHESSLTIADAIAADAFQRDPNGDPNVLATAMKAIVALLSEYFPAPSR